MNTPPTGSGSPIPQKKRLMKKNQRRFSMRRFLFPGIFAITLLGIFLWNNPKNIVRSATYTWVQSTWTGGATANTGVHPTNQTGWTEYSAKDSATGASTNVTLDLVTQTSSDTTDTNFSAGTLTNTATSGTGSAAAVSLSETEGSSPVESLYQSGSLFFPFNTLDTSGNLWALSNGSPFQFVKVTPSISGSSYSNTCSGGNSPGGIAYDPVTPAVWVTNASDRKVCRFNPTTGAELSETTIGSNGSVGRMVYDPANQAMWLLNYTSGTLYKLDLNANILNTYPLPTELGLGTSGYNLLVYEATTASIFTVIYDFSLDANLLVKKPTNGDSATYVNIGGVGTGGTAVMTAVPSVPAVWLGDANYGAYRVNASSLVATSHNSLYTALSAMTYDSAHDIVWTTHSSQPYLRKWTTAGVSSATYNTTYRGNSFDAQYDPVRKRMWMSRGGSGGGVWSVSFISYAASGTFVSRIHDTTANTSFGNATWVSTTPTNTTLAVRARTSNSPTMVGAPAFNTCNTLTSGNDISANNCVTDGHRYIQYEATLATANSAVSPNLDSLSFDYTAYTNGTLTSSPFDAGDATNVVSKIAWTASGSGTVQFQIRTSPNNSDWSSWYGPTGTGDYYTDNTGNQTIHTSHADGSNDRYMQWKVFLSSADGITTPTLTNVTMTYVVNAPPEFQTVPVATQGSDGIVNISFSIRDADTTAGSVTPGFVTPTYEYSINNGTNWNAITTGLSAGATSNKAVQEVQYTDYAVTWDAKQQIDGTYAAQTKIRIRLNDNEGANNTALSESLAFVLDVKDPTLGSPAIAADASSTPATISLNASDDSALEMCVTLTNTATNCVPYASSTTVSLATNPDTVYVIYRDARGNTSSSSAVTPETPANLVIRDLSNIAANQYFLFISWRSVSTPLNQFGDYHVWHSTDGSTYALLTSISDRSINYYLHQNLSDGSTHYYKVTSTDADGNISTYSTVVSDTVNGQGGTDATPPTISAISAVATTQSVAITWDTDELSNSTVGYSATAGDFTTESGVATMVDSASGLGAHRVTIGGLTPNTTYYYRVQSSDPSGNLATSDNGGDGFSFTTTSGPAITNVTTPVIENTSAVISWKTNTAATSKVTYSTSAALTNSTSVESTTEVTTHALTLTNLTIGTRYYFQVQSGTGIDTNNGNYYTFVTTADTTAPVITNVAAVLVTDTQALIRWETNERSSSQVSYGKQPAAPTLSTAVDSVLNLTHSITLNNLTTETQYYFTVRSADAAGNSATSSEVSFTTREQLLTDSEVQTMLDELRADTDSVAPGITDVVVTPTSPRTATATWSTDETANSFLELTPTGGETMILGDWVYVSAHTLTAPALTPATTYAYRVISADRSGNISVTPSATFTTSALSLTELTSELEEQVEEIEAVEGGLPAPVIGGQPRVDVSATAATISWTTSTATDGLVSVASASAYQSAQSFEQHIASPTKLSTAHSVRLPNLQPDTAYVFRVSGQPKVGPTVTSATLPFQTLTKTFGIDNYTVEMISDEAAIFRWTTTEESTSVIQYVPYRNGTPAVEELRELRDDRTNFIHQMTITNFEPGAQYGVTLISLNSAGQQTSLAIDPFRTEANDAPPEISNIRIDSALSPGQKVRVQTIVAWQTNKPTTSQVQYRAGVQPDDSVTWEESPLDPSFTKRHIAILTTLNPGSVYQVQVKNRDANGQEVISQPITFLTPQQQQSVFQVILNTVERTFGWTKIFN